MTDADRFEPNDIGQRRRGPKERDGHFAVVWVDGAAPTSAVSAPSKHCRECGAPSRNMHQDPRNNLPERVVCGECQGKINRERMAGGGRW